MTEAPTGPSRLEGETNGDAVAGRRRGHDAEAAGLLPARTSPLIARFSRFVLRCAIWAVDRFLEIGRVGGDIPAEGPVLIIANHPNSLIDALVVLRVAGRRVRPLAKAPLFDRPVFGHVLRGLGALPVYRPQDYPGETRRNERTFGAAVESLQRGEAVLIFPEGMSHSSPALARMKTGAARLALEAEESAGWELGLRVVPIGLTYQRKHAFRGRVAACVGEPFGLGAWRAVRQDDEWAAVEGLVAEMRRGLEKVTLNLPSPEDRALVETAEALYAAEKRLHRPRERDGLAPRLPRLQRFAEAMAWLHVTDPDRYERLAGSVRGYRHRLDLLGVREGEMPERFTPAGVLRFVLFECGLLLLGLPLAAAGTAAWYLPYKSPLLTVRLVRPEYEALATVKLATAFVAFPLTYAAWLGLAWWMGGLRALVVVAVLLPMLGAVALRWRDRWGRVTEDAGIFWRSVRRRGLRQEVAARRQTLVAEFDAVAEWWRREEALREAL